MQTSLEVVQILRIALYSAVFSVLASAQAQTGDGDKAPPEIYQGPDATAVHPGSTMQAGNPWIAEMLQDQTFVTRHHIPYSRVDMSKADEPNQVGVGVELTGAERFVSLGELNWRRHPSGHYAAVIAYTVEQARTLRIALNLKGFPKRLTVKFVSADRTRPYPEASLDHAAASGYLNRDVPVHWSPIHSGDTVYVELNHPDITEAGFAAGRIELPRISYIFAGGPWGVKTQPEPAPSADGGFAIAKARVATDCIKDVSCSITGISDTAKENFSRATGLLMITQDGGLTSMCTGHLIADSDPTTARPYMLTANHCIDTPTEAASIIVFWDYRPASCGGNVESFSSPRTRGSELLAGVTFLTQDWTFLILGTDNDPAVLPGTRYFLGWDSTAPEVGETLHHLGHSAVNPQSYARGEVTSISRYRRSERNRGMMLISLRVGHTSGGASGSVFVRIDGDSLYARSGGLSGGEDFRTCLIISPSDNSGYFGSAIIRTSPFILVYQNQQVRSHLGSGRQRAEGTDVVRDDIIVTLASSAEVIEGDVGSTRSLVFNLMRSGTTTQALPFRWESLTSGSAVAGLDYIPVPSSPGIFPAGSATTILSVTVRGDAGIEPDETIHLRVVDSGGVILAESLVGVIRANDDDHGNIRADATRLSVSNTVNTVVRGRLEYEADVDYFLLTVPRNSGTVLLTADSTSGFFIDGLLEDSNGDRLIDGTFGVGGVRFGFKIEGNVGPGDYYIWVRSLTDTTTGTYTLSVSLRDSDDHSNASADATVLDLSSGSTEVAGVIDPGDDLDYFRFNHPANFGAARVTAYTSSNLDTDGVLEDSRRILILRNQDGGAGRNFRIRINVVPGDYYISVRSPRRTTGAYTLHVSLRDNDDHSDIRAGATVLDLSSGSIRVAGVIDPKEDVDYFRFDIPANFGAARVTIRTSGNLNTFGTLEDSRGMYILSSSFGGGGRNFRVEESVVPGGYYIQVDNFERGGNYFLHVRVEAVSDDSLSVTVPGDGLISVNEDQSLVLVAVATVGLAAYGQTIASVSVASSRVMMVNAGGSSISDLLSSPSLSPAYDGETVLFEATPLADRFGTAVFTVAVTDSEGESSTFAFTLMVEAVNDAPVIMVAEGSSPLELIVGAPGAVSASVSDVDVSAEDRNLNRFAQAGDTLVFRLSESAAGIMLRLRDGLADEEGMVLLDRSTVATVQGDGGAQTTLTFTAGLTAGQVEELMSAVEVSAEAESAEHELTIALTTGVNEERRGHVDRLTGSAVVRVQVFAADGPPALESAEPGVLVEGATAAAVTLRLDRNLQDGESVTVTYTLDFSGAGATGTDVTDPNNGELTLGAPNNEVSIQLRAVDDANVEGGETFVVRFTAAFRADDGMVTNLASGATRTVAVRDATPPLQASFDQAAYAFVENAANPAAVLNVRSGTDGDATLVSTASVSVVTVDGTAEASADDYTARTGDSALVGIPAGVYSTTARTISIRLPIRNDNEVEPDETFVLRLTAPDGRVTAVAPAETTVTILNDDAATAVVTFTPQTVTVERGSSTNVRVGLEPLLIRGQAATLRLTAVQGGLTVSGSATHDVALDDVTTSQVVTVLAASDASLGDHEVTAAVFGPAAEVSVATPATLMVTVTPAILEVRQSLDLVGVPRDVTESELQAGVLMDAGIVVGFVRGSESIGGIRAALEGGSDGDLAGAAFSAAATEGFAGSDGEYTSAPGATVLQAQNLLRSLTLVLGTQDPPTRATVTVSVESLSGFSEVTVEYPLAITDENEPPVVVTVLSTRLTVLEDSEAAKADIVVVDPVEPGQSILDTVTVAASTVTVSSGGMGIGDLLRESLADVFSADNGEPGTVTFTGTPAPNAHGDAEFALRAMNSGGGNLSSTFLFTLTVEPVNDTPVITVADDPAQLILVGGGAPAGVTVSLSDVDVSAAAGNEGLFAQAGDTLVMSVSTDTAALTLRGLATATGNAMLNGTPVATVAGNASSRIQLTFTGGLTAAQVKTLIEAVRVSATVTIGSYELSIALTTDFNDDVVRREEDRQPLAGVAVVPVRVIRRTVLTVSFDQVAIALSAGGERAVGLGVDPPLAGSEVITVGFEVESEAGSTAVTLSPPEVVFNMGRPTAEVVVRAAETVSPGTTARVTIETTATSVGGLRVEEGDSLLVKVAGILLRIRVFLEGALQ